MRWPAHKGIVNGKVARQRHHPLVDPFEHAMLSEAVIIDKAVNILSANVILSEVIL